MKKRIITLMLAVAMLFAVSVTASAADAEIGFDASYNAETGLVSVLIYIDNAKGLQSADLNLGYDPEMYEFEKDEPVEMEDGMIMTANIERIPGLCTCAIIFTEECEEKDLDSNGRLNLATYTFKPINDEYDINEFCLWASSFDINDVRLNDSLPAKGNTKLQEDKTEEVTFKGELPQNNTEKTTNKGTQSASGDITSKWYVYLIAGVLAVGAIAGIAFVAMKNGHSDEAHDEAEEKKEDSEDK